MCSDNLPKEAFQCMMDKIGQFLAPLPPNTTRSELEKRRMLLQEEAIRRGEKTLELTNKETEFMRNTMDYKATNTFRPPRDERLHRNLGFNDMAIDPNKSVYKKYSYSVDPKTKMCYFYTPARNMEAAQDIMQNKAIPEDECLHYSLYLLKKGA